MTKITFYSNRNGKFTGFDAEDHAGAAEEGEDIVCAAVSVLVIHTVNSLERFTDDRVSDESDEAQALVKLRVEGDPSDEAELLLKALAQTLSDMQDEKSYRDFIDVNYVEV